MFTGIVERTGIIRATRPVAGGHRLSVDVGQSADDCAPGASICVSGVCLTVAAVMGHTVDFDVVAETLEKSTLGNRRVGDAVNIELSLRAGDRIDGHFVQGHVDGTATVDRIEKSRGRHDLWFDPDSQVRTYIVPKGSVAIDGVSLTIAAVESRRFSVAIIPTTLQRTTLSTLSVGDLVNIETDIIVRTIVHHLSELAPSGGLTLDALRGAGLA